MEGVTARNTPWVFALESRENGLNRHLNVTPSPDVRQLVDALK
jgi:hypothetical protein